MKQLLLLSFLSVCGLLSAQKDDRYLAGAVPEEGGKVVFTKEISNPSLTQDCMYDSLHAWARTFFSGEGCRLVYLDKDEGSIAAVGEEYLVFQNTTLSLDRAMMDYRVTIECRDHMATVKLAGIRYEYHVSYQKEPEKYTAEKWITDKYALNKKRNKLNRSNGKFRRKTVDFVDDMFQSIDAALGTQQPASVTTVPAVQSIASATVSGNTDVCQGMTAFDPEKIPSTLLDMLPESRMEVTAAVKEDLSERYAQWKGIGKMMGKNIASISISADSEVYRSIGNGGIYTLSFKKDDSPEVWFMIQCIRQGETEEGGRKTLIGEILNVWIR